MTIDYKVKKCAKMENSEKVNVQKFFLNSIDLIIKEESSNKNRANFEYLYSKAYKKGSSLSTFAQQLKEDVEHGLQGKVDLNFVLQQSFFTPEEKQTIITYLVSTALLNTTEEQKIESTKNKTLVVNNEVNFHNLANKYNNFVRDLLSKKEYVDENGVKYNGADIFGNVKNVKASRALNEFALTSFLISTAVVIALGAASPAIAKTMPGTCEVVRNCAEKYPVATKIINWVASPVDLDAFIEQDKINKGEVSESDEIGNFNFADENGGEDIDADEVIMSDGSVASAKESEVGGITTQYTSKEPKKEMRKFINANGEEQTYEFIDYDA